MSCMHFIAGRAHELIQPLALVQREAILRAMILARGNLRTAAKSLQISRATLCRKLKQFRDAEN